MLSCSSDDFLNSYPRGSHWRGWLVGLLLFSLVSPSMVSADIFEWEWVDPADPTQGKQQSNTVVPDLFGRSGGAGLVPAPFLYARFNNLTQAYLIGFDLTNANFGDFIGVGATLTNADLSGANLTKASFTYSTLTNADFTNAEVHGANLSSTTNSGFTAPQLYSTASYQAHDLTGISLETNDLTGWDFGGQNLTNAYLFGATLTEADLSGANLTNARFRQATLTNADLTNAEVRGANFSASSGLTAAHIYSTASYQARDLTGINLEINDLSGLDFVGQNLTDARFYNATLTNADLSGANLTNASFNSATLTNADLSGANLMRAIFNYATLTNTDFTNADVRGAHFSDATYYGFTAAQLYSTASYQAGDLTGISLWRNDLTGWNFVGQNLTDADFGRATLASADLSRTDARAARDMELSSAITHNFIHPDGHVAGLDITADEVMRLWDYNLATAIPIFVEDAMSIDSTGTLRAVFEDDDWGSTLMFAAGIGVSLDGTLELLIDPREGSDVFGMVGTTFDLFDWTGVAPSGTFAQIITSAGLTWDTSNLYTTGEVTLLAVIPEPSTYALVLLGMAGCGWCGRRR